MTRRVVPFNHFADLQHVRRDEGWRVFCRMVLALDSHSPGQTDYFISNLCSAHWITPGELQQLSEALQRHRQRRRLHGNRSGHHFCTPDYRDDHVLDAATYLGGPDAA